MQDLFHLCWRKRDKAPDDPDLDLVIVPEDAAFVPYTGQEKIPNKSPIAGRICVLKFHSSSERKFFWLQAREQPVGDPSHFSTRDLRMIKMIDNFMQNNNIDDGLDDPLYGGGYPRGEDAHWDDDQDMEDVQEGEESTEGATGADARDEGEESREGGADGGRA